MPNLLIARRFYEGEIFKLDNHITYSIAPPSRISLPDNTFLETGIFENRTFYRISDIENENTLGLLITTNVTHNGKNYCELSNVEILNRRKGYCSFLYKYIVTTSEIPVISDNLNTSPGSMDVWKSLRFKWNPKNYIIGYINLHSDRVFRWTKKTEDHNIWGMSQVFISDMAELDDENLFENMLEFDDLSSQHYKFLNDNKVYLKDREMIRLYAFKK